MKKYFNYLTVFSLFALFLFNTCDKIEAPYKEVVSIPTADTVRKILLEEFTGHTCTGCPGGAAVVRTLKNIYGKRLILISIHASDFAEPGTGEFSNDFRSTTGNEIFTTFPPPNFPTGMVSRTRYGSADFITDKGHWGERIDSLKNLNPKAFIKINNSYNSGSVTSTIECNALQDLQGVYKLTAYLTEDSLVGGQDSLNSVILHNYVFRDVLRGSLNGTWGETLSSGDISVGTTITKIYSMALNPSWNPDRCSVVAFISDSSNYEIIQVEEKRVK